jgi:hypothetical protein
MSSELTDRPEGRTAPYQVERGCWPPTVHDRIVASGGIKKLKRKAAEGLEGEAKT